MLRERACRVIPTPAAVPAARRFVSDALQEWGIEDAAPVTVLLASELVTNAIVHAGSPAELRVELHNGTVRVEVYDDSRQVPLLRRPGFDAEAGRGLQVVDSLASRWGASAAGKGKLVWFEVAYDSVMSNPLDVV